MDEHGPEERQIWNIRYVVLQRNTEKYVYRTESEPAWSNGKQEADEMIWGARNDLERVTD